LNVLFTLCLHFVGCNERICECVEQSVRRAELKHLNHKQTCLWLAIMQSAM